MLLCPRSLSVLTPFALVAVVDGAGPETDFDRAMALLDTMETTRLSVDYLEEPLAVVLDDLAERGGVPVRADWEALRQLGIRARDLTTLRIDRAPLSTVFSGLTLVLGDDLSRPVYEVHAGQVVLTALEATEPMRLTDVYDVRDLVRDGQTMSRLRAAPVPVPEGDGEPDEDPGEGPDLEISGPAAEWAPGEELLHLIVEHVDPEAWIDFGGSRGKISERNGMLLVTAVPTTHRMLRDALSRLRAATPSGLELEVVIIEIDRGVLERQKRTHAAGSRAFARGLLRNDETTVLWRTSASMTLGQPFQTRVEAESTAVNLELRPQTSTRTDQLEVYVKAETVLDGDRSEVTTTVHLPPRRAGAVIELPTAEPKATIRCLVLLPAS